MPELPEVETVARGLSARIAGDVIASAEQRRADLRVPFPARFAARLAGRRIEAIGRRAKYLTFRLDDGTVLVVHLGMSGSFRLERADGAGGIGFLYRTASKKAAHDHVVLHMRSGADVVYNDPRRFGLMDLVAESDLAGSPRFRHLGVEPLDGAFDGAALARLFAGRVAPLKAALLDQRLVAGLGNIYVCEALWRAKLKPGRAAGEIVTARGAPRAAAGRLAGAVKAVLTEAIDVGGSSLRDHILADGGAGAFQNRFAVYDREGAACPRPRCRGIVRRTVHAGRSTFFCPVCQR